MSGPEGIPHPCLAIVQLVVMGGELGGLGEGLLPPVHPGSGFNLRLWLFGPQPMLQLHHSHARALLWTLPMHTGALTHERTLEPDPRPASSPMDLPSDLGSGLCPVTPLPFCPAPCMGAVGRGLGGEAVPHQPMGTQ